MSGNVDISYAVQLAALINILPVLAGGRVYICKGERPVAGAPLVADDVLLYYELKSPAGAVDADNFLINVFRPEPANARKTGIATWGRIARSDGVWLFDGDCGALNSGAFIELNETDIDMGNLSSIASILIGF